LAATEFETVRGLKKIGKPVDRTEWDMSVWEANAYYSAANNEMVLPLGELVPPVFDPHFSSGANLAALGGSTIGHELSHGFDDSGKDMDADGNFVTWWTKKSKQNFDKLSECYINQTESYDILPGSGLHIRGKASLGENLADNAGAKLGLIVLKGELKKRKGAKAFEGFDELQQYFLAWAQGWCTKTTDEQLREQLMSGYHPPPEFRVNMVLANQPEFAKAFHCKAGSRMAPKKRCALW
jgi:endothelin-converting enzyme/putative endopeptidase